MDAFESCYPFCERKYDPFYVKKNLKAFAKKPQGKAARGKAGADYIVVKSDCGKSRRHTRSSQSEEGLAYNVPYSMNRKYRFATMQPLDIVMDTVEESKDVVVHQQFVLHSQAKNAIKSKYYKMDEQSVPAKVSFDVLGNVNTLNAQHVAKITDSKRRKKQKDLIDGEKENETGDVTLYTVSQCAPASGFKRSLGCGRKTRIRRRIQGRDFGYEEDFLWEDDSFEADRSDEWSTKIGLRKFSLEEFVLKPSKKQEADVAIENQYEVVNCEEPLVSPAFKVVDLPKEILNCFQFAMTFNTRRWKDFDFATEGERIPETLSENCEFSWLSDSHKAFAISIYGPSKFVKQNSNLFPVFNIVIELGPFQTISIRYEGNFKSEYPTRSIRSSLLTEKPDSLKHLVASCIKQFGSWNTCGCYSRYMRQLDEFSVDGATRIDCWSLPEYNSCLTSLTFCSNLEPVNDNDLLEMVEEKCAESSRESDDFEVIEHNQASCSVCGLTTASGMCALHCFHTVCIQCLRQHVLSQLRADVFPIHCLVTSCTSVIPLTLLKCLLPIPFFIYYVRRSYKHMKQAEDRLTTCCPGCLRIGTVPKEIRFKTLRCAKCKICFCIKCNSPPHWPLSCDEAALWIKKFKLSEKYFLMRYNGLLKENMVVRECYVCKKELEAPDMTDSLSCDSCIVRWYGSYDWATGEFRLAKYVDNKFEHGGKIIQAKDIKAKLVRRYCPKYFVQTAYCKKWMGAKAERFSEDLNIQITFPTTSQDKLSRKQSDINLVKECKRVGCYLLEYGWVWLYMHRKDEDVSWKEVQTNLKRLEKTWENMKEKFQIDTLTEVSNGELQKLVSKFDRTVQMLIAFL